MSFKEAALSLDVTPSIDETGVLLDVKLAKDEPDFSKDLILFITPTLIPAIDVAQAQDLRSRQPQ